MNRDIATDGSSVHVPFALSFIFLEWKYYFGHKAHFRLFLYYLPQLGDLPLLWLTILDHNDRDGDNRRLFRVRQHYARCDY